MLNQGPGGLCMFEGFRGVVVNGFGFCASRSRLGGGMNGRGMNSTLGMLEKERLR